jgi:microsomal epoxide hydrolase
MNRVSKKAGSSRIPDGGRSRLGYQRYGAQGGDWGSGISRELGLVAPERLIGSRLNSPPAFPVGDPSRLGELDRQRLGSWARHQNETSGYVAVQSTRPQTLTYALNDSPVGSVKKCKEWTDSTGVPESAVDRDHMLTNVTLYGLAATDGSSARLYKESARTWTVPRPHGLCRLPARHHPAGASFLLPSAEKAAEPLSG